MNLNIDLLSLQAFLTVCAEGSLARAAHKLFLSEPAVSVRMRRLEDKLGIKLLIRSQRGVRPTYAGDLLRPVFEQLLGGLDASIVEAQAAAKRWTTRIVFWTPTAFMPYVLAGVLARLAEAHSHVQLVARSESSEDVLPPLLDGRIDCAILPEASQ